MKPYGVYRGEPWNGTPACIPLSCDVEWRDGRPYPWGSSNVMRVIYDAGWSRSYDWSKRRAGTSWRPHREVP